VPIPRRFDRRPPERDQTRINERIRVPEVRLIGEDGNQVGVLSRDDALAYARQRDLDLVEVAAEARPPVCRVLDYSKYKYEQEQKAKQARKHQKQVTVREIKLRPKIATNDYETKKNHVERFLKHQDRVKITIMFRGRETTHPERGERLLMQLAEDVSEFGTIEQRPNLDGRNMTMLLAPLRQKEEPAAGAASDAAPAAGGEAAPAAAGEAAPPAAGDAAPAAAAASDPADAADGDAADAADGDAAPAAPDDAAPPAASDAAPAAAGDAAPAADGDAARAAAAATPPDDAGAPPATAPPAAAADDAASA
jgi:translation initiation factor IF-3